MKTKSQRGRELLKKHLQAGVTEQSLKTPQSCEDYGKREEMVWVSPSWTRMLLKAVRHIQIEARALLWNKDEHS